jgi:hypothetical protein
VARPLTDVALHEGAHAVAANTLGVEVVRVQLHDDGSGTTTLAGLPEGDPSSVRRAMVITLAGDAAVAAGPPLRLDWRL